MVKRKIRISTAERQRRRKQALKNFGIKGNPPKRTTTRKVNPVAKKRSNPSRRGMRVPPLMRDIAPGVVVGIIDPFVNQLSANFGLNIPDDIIKLLGGVLIVQTSRPGILKDTGKALVTIGTANLTKQFMAGQNILQPTAAAAPIAGAAAANGNPEILA